MCPIPSPRSLALLSLAIFVPAASSLAVPSSAHVDDRVVVVFHPDLCELPEHSGGSVPRAPWATGAAELDLLLDRLGARELVRVARNAGSPTRDPLLFHALGLDRHYVIELEPGSDEDAVRAELARSALVVEARLDAIAHAVSHPNDPLYGQQWNHHVPIGSIDPDIDTDLAWDLATGGIGVKVAVLDTGFHMTHPDLAGGLLAGYDFVNNNASPGDDHGHGTWITGILAARGNNGIGIAGVAWSASILTVKVLDWDGSGSWSDIAAGITWAANNGAQVINMSLGGYGYDSGVEAALAYATGLDALCIAASGNDNVGTIMYPAAMPNCMAVGASDSLNNRWDELMGGSNFGPELDLVAPGVSITTTALSNGYISNITGTSAAAPHVAGVAALVRALAPTLSQAKVRDILLGTADDLIGPGSEDTPGFDPYYGRGKLDANQAVLAVHPQATRRVSITAEGFQAMGSSQYAEPSISDDGRYVAFASAATNLVPGDVNGQPDIFVLDRMTGIQLWANIGLNYAQANSSSSAPAISGNGRYVAFHSYATNLVGGDTNGQLDAFVHDRLSAANVRVSLSTSGAQSDGMSMYPAISATGRYVAFQSLATNLVAGDTNGVADVFLRDRDTDGDGVFDEPGAVSTTRVSIGPGGVQANAMSGYFGPSISSDGLHIAFRSSATNLGATNPDLIYVRDLTTNTTAAVSVTSYGGEANYGCFNPVISGNGRFVAFYSLATIFGGDSPEWSVWDVFVVDRDTDADGIFDEPGAHASELVSTSSTEVAGDNSSFRPAISDDGRYVAFHSQAANLVSGDTNGVDEVFVRDRSLGLTQRVSVSSALAQANDWSSHWSTTEMTASGHIVVFESDASNLVVDDTNGVSDVYVREVFQTHLLATSFCFCTGNPWTPPCGNASSNGQGCRNSTGVGATLSASGTSSLVRDDLVLGASGLPTFKTTLLFMGGGLSNGTTGALLGDGRICVGSGGLGLFRYPTADSGAGGSITAGPGLASLSASLFGAAGAITAGSTWNFQCWYRDGVGPCGQGTNISNAVAITFVP